LPSHFSLEQTPKYSSMWLLGDTGVQKSGEPKWGGVTSKAAGNPDQIGRGLSNIDATRCPTGS
jgi:hypothetical protein